MKKHPSVFILFILVTLCFASFLLFSSCERVCEHPNFFEETVSPTCSEEGKTVHVCDDCGYEYVSDIVSPLGHRMESTIFSPTCLEQGYTTYSCADCDYSYSSDYTAPLSHSLREETVNATCTESGYVKHSCERCEYSYEDSQTPPSHAHYTAETALATCVQSGYTEYACHNCSYRYKLYSHYSDLLPSAYTENTEVLARGIDVSNHQHAKDANGNYLPLDWTAIKNAGFDYVILKIGSTPRNNGKSGGKEATFEMNYAGAKAAGLDVGVYFFTYATTVEQNIADADLVAEWLAGKQLEYPVYYDVEDYSYGGAELPDRNTLTDFCVAFISRLQEKGFYCGLYTNRDWLQNKLDTARCTAFFDIWYARYRDIDTPYYVTDVFNWTYGDQFGMWQYACTGKIEGIDPNTNFDFNYTYKDFPSIMKQFHLNGY